MRQKRTDQVSIYEQFADHALGQELRTMSERLDAHRAVLTRVFNDLRPVGVSATGRRGLSAESVLRCAILKQHRQLSYEELAFYLRDSASFQAFARLPLNEWPKKPALQQVISAIKPGTWEHIQRALMATATQTRIEPGRRIRIDSTVTDSAIHALSDSHLLLDGVRVLVRLLKQARAIPGAPELKFMNHHRLAKKRAKALWYTRGAAKRQPLYRDLLGATRATLESIDTVRTQLSSSAVSAVEFMVWSALGEGAHEC